MSCLSLLIKEFIAYLISVLKKLHVVYRLSAFNFFPFRFFYFRDRIISALGKGIAPQYPPESQAAALQESMFQQGLPCILGAGGFKPARIDAGFSQGAGQPALVPVNHPHTDPDHHLSGRGACIIQENEQDQTGHKGPEKEKGGGFPPRRSVPISQTSVRHTY
mgnify:CR=1 FL=1